MKEEEIRVIINQLVDGCMSNTEALDKIEETAKQNTLVGEYFNDMRNSMRLIDRRIAIHILVKFVDADTLVNL